MLNKLYYDVPLAPLEVIERLTAETVPFESLTNIHSPFTSYATFLKETLVGPKQVVAKIDANHFRLMTIGFWPFKGPSLFANVGAMYGTVEQSTGGSIIHAQFRIAPTFLAMLLALSGLLVFVLVGAISLLVFASGLEGRFMLLVMCAFFTLIAFTMFAYVFVGARVQARSTRKFLDELVASIAA
jgi:hypothetical protein